MAVAALAAWLLVIVLVRVHFGSRPLILPYGHSPGLDLLRYNLFRYRTWVELAGTFTLIPALSLWGLRRSSPQLLVRFFWIVVPAWLVTHLLGSVMAETRLLLVPFVVVLVPMALFALDVERATGIEPATAVQPRCRQVVNLVVKARVVVR